MHVQGVVTVIELVEPFATAIKITSRAGIKTLICSESSDQETLQRGDQAAQKSYF